VRSRHAVAQPEVDDEFHVVRDEHIGAAARRVAGDRTVLREYEAEVIDDLGDLNSESLRS